jgi:macrodomain Ter protein organizer (MatP/YcbG family)
MSASTKLVDKLESVENLCAWKYRIALILEENDLARFIKENVPEPTDVATKAKHQKDSVRAKRSIADSIKDHLIPKVASKKTPKKMFDALTRLYEGRNINLKMNLRTQLKNTRMQKGETIQEYFSRISQFKEQLEANSVRVPNKKKDVSKIKCYNCQKLGHFSYDCPQGKGKRKHQAHVAKEEESPPSKKALVKIEKYVL